MSKRMAAIFVLGWTFSVLVICGGVLFIHSAVERGKTAPKRTQCKYNLKNIGLALRSYADVYGSFPPAFIPDATGKPMHSWRVLILPYLGQQALYDEYDFAEPWDGPNNSRLLARTPAVYVCPSHVAPPGNTNTAYAAPLGVHCIFRGAEPVAFKDILDGESNTVMVGEAANANIPWTKPDDVRYCVASCDWR